jgi:redox-sensitive bicupin YhaK (pirin superfamily)
LLGAQIDLAPAATVALDVDSTFEHGVLLDRGEVEVDDTRLAVADLSFHGTGHDRLCLVNRGDEPARVLVLGGTPFPDQLVMWWNFVGRNHDEIAEFRSQWEAHADRFGAVEGYRGALARLPAPPLPKATLRPRPNPPR